MCEIWFDILLEGNGRCFLAWMEVIDSDEMMRRLIHVRDRDVVYFRGEFWFLGF